MIDTGDTVGIHFEYQSFYIYKGAYMAGKKATAKTATKEKPKATKPEKKKVSAPKKS